MAFFRKLFYRKPPDGLLEISERVYVFDCCFSADTRKEGDFKNYIGGIVGQLREHFPDASILVFNFCDEDGQSLMSTVLSEYDMTIMDYPRHYEGCPLLKMEVIHHFLRSCESWLSLGQQNVLLMHCEQGGWPVLAFMLAALLIYRRQFSGEQKTLDMVYKQAPNELLKLFCHLNPVPSQLRYLRYVTRRNVTSEWPPAERALNLDCIILRLIPNVDGEGGCCPFFRVYGHDPVHAGAKSKLLYSTPRKGKPLRTYKQGQCELAKIDIRCHVEGDVVLECISLHDGIEHEEMMFRVMFNTGFIRSNILILNRDEIDILWDAKDQFPKDFRAEILFSEIDATGTIAAMDFPQFEEKEGLPVEAFAKVQEIFSHVDWLGPRADVAMNMLQHLSVSSISHENSDPQSPRGFNISTSLEMSPKKLQKKCTVTVPSVLSPKASSEAKPGSQDSHSALQPTGPTNVLCDSTPQLCKLATVDAQSTQRSVLLVSSHGSTTLDPVVKPILQSHVSSKDLSATQSGHAVLDASEPTLALSSRREFVDHKTTPKSPEPMAPKTPSLSESKGACSSPIQEDEALSATNQSASSGRRLSTGSPFSTVINDSSSSTPAPPSVAITASATSVHENQAVGPEPSHLPIPSLSPDTSLSTTLHPATPPVRDNIGVQPRPCPTSLSKASPTIASSIPTSSQRVYSSVSSGLLPLASPTVSLDALSTTPLLTSSLKEHTSVKKQEPPPPPPPPPAPATASSLKPLARESSGVGTQASSLSPTLASATVSSVKPLVRESSGVGLQAPAIPAPPSAPKIASPAMPQPATLPTPPVRKGSGIGPQAPSPPLPPARTIASSGTPPPPPPPAPRVNLGSIPGPPPPPLCSGQALGLSGSAPNPPPPSPLNNPSNVPSAPPPPPCALDPKGSGGPQRLSTGNNGRNSPGGSLSSGLQYTSSNGPKGRLSRTITSKSNQMKKLKPLHWLKLSRAVHGSLWAEAQKLDEASKAPEIDMKELENLFSAAAPNSDHGGRSSLRGSRGPKSDRVHLVEHRRAYNCEIMLSKVKVPLQDLMNSVLALEDSALDVDQVENLIKFCPTKDEMELVKGYNGDKEKLGKCEQFFYELMQVPRVEAKLRVLSFKMQFHTQVSDLRNSLNLVNCAAEEIRNSVKLKRIMQTILSLGNALNQGTARGSAIGFRLDSLLKLTETRARNNRMTLMHYLCKVLADKMPELLDFSKDLSSMERASKIQLKFLAEEMQAISKGLEKVMQELSSSENDGPVSETFCKKLKEFLRFAEAEVRSLALLYSGVGRNVDALIIYFGEDPARCPFEQVISTLLNFMRMFNRAQEENCKQLELEMKKSAESESKQDHSIHNQIEKRRC